MNKRVILLLIVVFVLGCLFSAFLTKFLTTPENSYILIHGNRVEIQGGISFINLSKLDTELKNTPGYNKDTTIVVMRDKLVTPEGQTIKGMYKKGVIYINSAHIDSVLHEIGHVVDEKYGCISQTEEFLNIYNSIEHRNHHTNSAEEYFAESYKEYVKGDLLNPYAVEFFDRLFE